MLTNALSVIILKDGSKIQGSEMGRGVGKVGVGKRGSRVKWGGGRYVKKVRLIPSSFP